MVNTVCLCAAASDEDAARKRRLVVNGVGSSLSLHHHVTSGSEVSASAAAALWTPVSSGPDVDRPLNLSVSRPTRRIPGPPSPDIGTAGSVDAARKKVEVAAVRTSPPPAHNPFNAAKTDSGNPPVRKLSSTIPCHGVQQPAHSVCVCSGLIRAISIIMVDKPCNLVTAC